MLLEFRIQGPYEPSLGFRVEGLGFRVGANKRFYISPINRPRLADPCRLQLLTSLATCLPRMLEPSPPKHPKTLKPKPANPNPKLLTLKPETPNLAPISFHALSPKQDLEDAAGEALQGTCRTVFWQGVLLFEV